MVAAIWIATAINPTVFIYMTTKNPYPIILTFLFAFTMAMDYLDMRRKHPGKP